MFLLRIILNFFINQRIKAFTQLLDKKVLLTTQEAAELLEVHEGLIRGFARAKKHPIWAIKVGSSMLYKKADLDNFKKNNLARLKKLTGAKSDMPPPDKQEESDTPDQTPAEDQSQENDEDLGSSGTPETSSSTTGSGVNTGADSSIKPY